jgi:hypothetical protein
MAAFFERSPPSFSEMTGAGLRTAFRNHGSPTMNSLFGLLGFSSKETRPRISWLAALGLFATASAFAEEKAVEKSPAKPDAAGVEFFEKHIRPVLVKQCYSCHSDNVQAKGGLRLDTRSGVLVGGGSGPAIVPGKPEQSELIDAIKYAGREMPPKNKLPDEVIARFEEWVKMGAPDPRDAAPAVAVVKREIDYDQARKYWAFQSPQAPAIPATRDTDWPRTDIDRLLHANQTAVGVKPVADAQPSTWLRRVTYDLTGLPPTLEELAEFEKESSTSARQRVVDRLLASPGFGEKWGRHWLDIARYAESTGKERNFPYFQAWKYRDYVIDAFNNDKPYDQFVREQIAGDLLPSSSASERDEQLIATGFFALGPKGINERNREQYLLDIVDEQIDNLSRGILGVTISCARCHDHKFDPIPTTDYYALAGIFRSSDTRAGIANRTRLANNTDMLIHLSTAPQEIAGQTLAEVSEELKTLDTKWRQLNQQINRLRNGLKPVAPAAAVAGESGVAANGPATVVPAPPAKVEQPQVLDAQPAAAQVADAKLANPTPEEEVQDPAAVIEAKQKEQKEIEAQVEKLQAEVLAVTLHNSAIGVVDHAEPADIAVRLRGEVDKLGPVVSRGFLTVLKSKSTPVIDPAHSGRLELAQWIASRNHPLTARVFVNRVWQKLFGEGIVPTVDDFGEQGQRPTHPELLDHLAVKFVEQGWSTKKLVREIVLSRVYGLSEYSEPKNAELDGQNKLLWQWNRKRLEAESLRDTLLSVSGQLDLSRPVGTAVTELGTRELGPRSNYAALQKPSTHRSVYLPLVRGQVNEMLALFDMADPSLIVGQRDVTSGPTQALYLMNSPLVIQQSEHFAKRLLAAEVASDADHVELAFRLVFSRSPTAAQREQSLKFLQEYEQLVLNPPGDDAFKPEIGVARLTAWSALCQSLFASPDFRYLF